MRRVIKHVQICKSPTATSPCAFLNQHRGTCIKNLHGEICSLSLLIPVRTMKENRHLYHEILAAMILNSLFNIRRKNLWNKSFCVRETYGIRADAWKWNINLASNDDGSICFQDNGRLMWVQENRNEQGKSLLLEPSGCPCMSPRPISRDAYPRSSCTEDSLQDSCT